MRTVFNTVLLSMFLISCSKSEQDSSSLKLKHVKNSKEVYFSKDIKYQCDEASLCKNEVKLIAIKQNNTITRCTGISIGDGTFFDSRCLNDKSDISIDFCKENIEVHNLENEITKCENTECKKWGMVNT